MFSRERSHPRKKGISDHSDFQEIRMRIATFNVNSVRSRLDIVRGWLAGHKPDVFCMQETKVTDDQFPAAAFQEAGYRVSFKGQKSYNGVAIATLAEPDFVSYGLDDGFQADETRLICVRVDGVSVVNTYVPQGRAIDHEMYRYKLDWLVRLRAYFNRHFKSGDKVVWVGDMNVAPGNDDVHNPGEQAGHVCYHADVRNAFERVLTFGFTDVFRKHHPEPGQYTFFDYRVPDALERRMGWRVDHIMATKPLAVDSVACEIDLEPRRAQKPSDHTVLYADFALKNAERVSGKRK